MEAHDFGLRLLDDVAHRGVERGAIARGHRGGGIDRELAIIRGQSFPPSRLAGVAGHRRRMAEEIEIYRFPRAGANFPHLLADLLRIEHRARQRAERARFRRGCYQFPVDGSGHRRLDDRKLDLEQFDQAAIRPHVRTTLADATP